MRNKLRILILSDVYYPTPGGVSEHIFNFAQQLRRKGHKVVIVAPGCNKKTVNPEHNQDVVRVGKAMPITANKSLAKVSCGMRLYWEVRDIIRYGKWDIIHSHGPFAPMLPYLAHKFTTLDSVRNNLTTAHIATFHASYRDVFLYDITKSYLQNRFDRIDGSIAVSEEAKSSVLYYFNGDFTVIPNAVDINKFNPDLEKVDKFKPENFNVFFAGRFDTRKGVNYLVSAFYFVLKRIPNAYLWIGGGDKYRKFGLDIIRKRLTSKFPQYGKRISYLRFIPHQDLPRYFASADVFCSPAIGGESFGIVLIESMACGTPVVASDIPGYRDVVEHGVDGFLSKPRSVHDLAKKIIYLAENKPLRQQMASNGRKKVVEKFSWEKVTDQVEDYYYKVLEEKTNGNIR